MGLVEQEQGTSRAHGISSTQGGETLHPSRERGTSSCQARLWGMQGRVYHCPPPRAQGAGAPAPQPRDDNGEPQGGAVQRCLARGEHWQGEVQEVALFVPVDTTTKPLSWRRAGCRLLSSAEAPSQRILCGRGVTLLTPNPAVCITHWPSVTPAWGGAVVTAVPHRDTSAPGMQNSPSHRKQSWLSLTPGSNPPSMCVQGEGRPRSPGICSHRPAPGMERYQTTSSRGGKRKTCSRPKNLPGRTKPRAWPARGGEMR